MEIKLKCPNTACKNKKETMIEISEFPKAIKCADCCTIMVLTDGKQKEA